MERTKLVIASLLKPIDDTRMFEKFGLSLAETNKYDINIIGFDSKNTHHSNNITFHPLEHFERSSIQRFLKPWTIFRKYIKVKPKVLIVNTHDLLLVTTLYKILFGCYFIYDVRENYVKNIRNTNVFKPWLRPLLAAWVRLKEWLSKPFISQYILAESVYAIQLPFIGKRFTIIENKYSPLPSEKTAYRNPDPSHIDLVFTGTVSGSNGVFEAIEITKALHEANSLVRMRIVGYCALKADLERLKESIKDCDFIELNGGDHLVPHSEIIEAIQKADFGFVLKKPNNGTNDEKLLTRLFEYTANKLPILLLNNPTWIQFCEQFNAAVVIDPANYDSNAILRQMEDTQFYNQGDTSTSLWASEKSKLLEVIS